jgi:hypothetical protein
VTAFKNGVSFSLEHAGSCGGSSSRTCDLHSISVFGRPVAGTCAFCAHRYKGRMRSAVNPGLVCLVTMLGGMLFLVFGLLAVSVLMPYGRGTVQ